MSANELIVQFDNMIEQSNALRVNNFFFHLESMCISV